MADADIGDYHGSGGGDSGVNVPPGSVALLSDPVDVIIDKLLRYVHIDERNTMVKGESRKTSGSYQYPQQFSHVNIFCQYSAMTAFGVTRQADRRYFGLSYPAVSVLH